MIYDNWSLESGVRDQPPSLDGTQQAGRSMTTHPAAATQLRTQLQTQLQTQPETQHQLSVLLVKKTDTTDTDAMDPNAPLAIPDLGSNL